MRRLEALVEPRGLHLSVEVPETPRERMRGLLGRERLQPGRAFLLMRARSVHTVGMRFPIVVAFLDARGRVIQVRRTAPGRVLLPRRGARGILECRAAESIRVGDRLRLLDAWRA